MLVLRSLLSSAAKLEMHLGCTFVKAFSFSYQSLEQPRRFPVIAETCPVLMHTTEDLWKADGFRVKHRTAAMTRESESVAVDDVDVGGPERKSILEHARAFVRQRRRHPCHDFIVV